MRYVDYTNFCLYRVDLPDVEQQACSKNIEAYYWNNLIENNASCWLDISRCAVNKTLNLSRLKLNLLVINLFYTEINTSFYTFYSWSYTRTNFR